MKGPTRNTLIGYFGVYMITGMLCLLHISCQNRSDTATDSLPNIVIILADDMGYGDIGALNLDARTLTPAIDRLIAEGIVFSDAHSSASVCTPSRYGLLTGRYAFRSEHAAYGIWGFDGPVIETGEKTIGSVLQKAGYTTACIGKWHLGLGWETTDGSDTAILNNQTGYSNVDYKLGVNDGPNNNGFEYSFVHPASLDIPPYVFLRDHQVVDPEVILTTDFYPTRQVDTDYSWDKKHTDEHAVYWEKGVWWRQGEMSRSFKIEDCHSTILAEGVDFIEKQALENNGKPFFLYLPLTSPHTPWVPTEKFKGKSSVGLYGDFVGEVDDAVDKVKRVLEKYGLDANTLLIFASDNGAYWPQVEIDLHQHDSNQGRRGQKGDIWEGGHRVPLIVSWPAQIEGPKVNQHLVSLTDVFATLAELVQQEVEVGQGGDSFSFLHSLQGDGETPIRHSMIHHSSRGMFAVRTQEWKFIDGLGSGGFTEPYIEDPTFAGPQGQLYHIATDSLELENLYLNHPDKVKELREFLRSITQIN